jgi:hypothetical protein
MWNLDVDKTNFPLVKLKDGSVFGLWPVTKIQFERFICESGEYGDKRYETACELNPRVSYRNIDKKNYEGIFMSGINPDDALKYTRWLGEGFDIPTINEWRHYYRLLIQEHSPENVEMELSPAADAIGKVLLRISRNALQFTLMEHGFVEWVHKDTGYAGLGVPRSAYYSNTCRPLTDIVDEIRLEPVPKFIAFRVIKRCVNEH